MITKIVFLALLASIINLFTSGIPHQHNLSKKFRSSPNQGQCVWVCKFPTGNDTITIPMPPTTNTSDNTMPPSGISSETPSRSNDTSQGFTSISPSTTLSTSDTTNTSSSTTLNTIDTSNTSSGTTLSTIDTSNTSSGATLSSISPSDGLANLTEPSATSSSIEGSSESISSLESSPATTLMSSVSTPQGSLLIQNGSEDTPTSFSTLGQGSDGSSMQPSSLDNNTATSGHSSTNLSVSACPCSCYSERRGAVISIGLNETLNNQGDRIWGRMHHHYLIKMHGKDKIHHDGRNHHFRSENEAIVPQH